jgi:hypothetical protein
LRDRDLDRHRLSQPSLNVHRSGLDTPLNVHPFRCNAHGRGRWSGLLPSDLKRLTLDPIGMSGRFEIRSVTLRRLPRTTVLARAARVDPVQVARALGWRLLGKRMRSRHFVDTALRRERGTSYADWIRLNDRLSAGEISALREMAAGWSNPPLISIVMPVYNPAPRDLEAAIASVRRQIYPNGSSASPTTPRRIAVSRAFSTGRRPPTAASTSSADRRTGTSRPPRTRLWRARPGRSRP